MAKIIPKLTKKKPNKKSRVSWSIVNNTVGRIYRGLTGLFNRKKHADRDFKFCFNFE